jgi:hypothetical protein
MAEPQGEEGWLAPAVVGGVQAQRNLRQVGKLLESWF